MRTQLLTFSTKDKLNLPGLLYEPNRKTKKVALYLHGNGTSSVFYNSNEHNATANELTKRGISYFPFNNRGAQLIKGFKVNKKRVLYGTAYECIRECVLDIDAAVACLKREGYREFYLIGASTGANKICVYDHYKKKRNPISKYILLAGGDDMGLYYDALGRQKFLQALRVSRQYSRSKTLAPQSMTPFFPLSLMSLYDTINPDGDYNVFPFNEHYNDLNLSRRRLFRYFSDLKKETLVIYGENDEYCIQTGKDALEKLKEHAGLGASYTFKLIRGADHGFTGKEDTLSRAVANWLST